ncbi:NeuD/PglB/VioB family sugar acetyltransferase [Synechococcus sp. LTW-R]|uniref:NeuD/PglB/VioB family sugar acetyltransferase n=1 Tax=Synechococcus sp. LTW-R TaxID=2751170 RepID=UPI001625D8E0|nr:NeuD/PglB/VioB family sugar acetyltransferase [Synechococcus sp. LTW-R]QNG29035.1 NeuD/PglB/VioB family sugar acetyltransferase [Synechococcus sp. LTW-R]
MTSLLLIGCGGHARSLIDIIEEEGHWKIEGLVGLPEQVGTKVLGYTVISSDSDLPQLSLTCKAAVLAVGQLPDARLRIRLASLLDRLGFEIPFVVSPHAVVSRHAILRRGTTVGHGSVVNAGAVIGSHCTLNTRCLIEHDVQIGDHCHVSTGAVINGGVKLGPECFIGSGSVLREGLELPARTVISAGKRVMGWPLL